jgi:hypothetical protein
MNFIFPSPQFGQAEPRSAGVDVYGSVLHTTAVKIRDKKCTSCLFPTSSFDKKDAEQNI